MIETIDLINQFMQLGCMAVATVLATRHAIRNDGEWFFQLLAGAFGCYFLGDLFYTLHLLILSDYAVGFSVADLSYLGSYCFLLSISLGLTGEWTDSDKRVAKPYRRVALTAPLIILLLHVAYVYLAGNPVNNALFCILLSFLAYYTLLLFLMSGKGTENEPSLRGYHGMVLFFLFVENMMFLISSLGFGIPFLAFDIMMSVTVLLMVRAARKVVAA